MFLDILMPTITQSKLKKFKDPFNSWPTSFKGR